MMDLSLNEVTALARKAARGAGYDWGLADEAGRAVRCLCTWGQDGVAALAGLLTTPAEAPILDGRDLRAQGSMCPIRAGVTLADRATLPDGGDMRLTQVTVPLLLLPFVARVAARLDRPIAVGPACVCADGVDLGTADWLAVSDLTVRPASNRPPAQPVHTRARPTPQAFQRLTDLAHLTYAPATEQSRRLGAGGAD